jgi:hypothetical protein
MPVFLDGQQNLAALTVPGVYGDIILPSPMIVGTATNIEGIVGVGSWGPLNALIPVSAPADSRSSSACRWSATTTSPPMSRPPPKSAARLASIACASATAPIRGERDR